MKIKYRQSKTCVAISFLLWFFYQSRKTKQTTELKHWSMHLLYNVYVIPSCLLCLVPLFWLSIVIFLIIFCKYFVPQTLPILLPSRSPPCIYSDRGNQSLRRWWCVPSIFHPPTTTSPSLPLLLFAWMSSESAYAYCWRWGAPRSSWNSIGIGSSSEAAPIWANNALRGYKASFLVVLVLTY